METFFSYSLALSLVSISITIFMMRRLKDLETKNTKTQKNLEELSHRYQKDLIQYTLDRAQTKSEIENIKKRISSHH